MRGPSEQIRSLLEQLERRQKYRIVQLSSTPVQILHRIGDSGEAAAIPRVLSYVLDRRQPVARAAAEAVAALLAEMPTSDLVSFDRAMRARSPWWGGWWSITPSALDDLAAFTGEHAALLCIATCHPSGFVREMAVRRLARSGDGREIPFLLIRLNDWVREVRVAATEALATHFEPDYAAVWIEAAPLLLRLPNWGRSDHKGVVDRAVRWLQGPACRDHLLEGLGSADRALQRACFEIALGAEDLDRAQVIGKALAGADPVLRLRAARLAVEEPNDDGLHALLGRLASDPFMPVRLLALKTRAARFPHTAEAAYRSALFDRGAAIRALGQRYLGQADHADVADIYRSALLTEPPKLPAAALLGLSEVGGQDDADLAARFLESDRPSVRAAAVRSLARLDGANQVGRILDMLSDGSAKVSREARSGLLEQAHGLDSAQLWHLVESASAPHIRKHALDLLNALPRWRSLGYLLRAAGSSDDVIRARAEVYLRRWLLWSTRAMLVPTVDQVTAISVLLDELEPRLEPELTKALRFLLRTVRR